MPGALDRTDLETAGFEAGRLARVVQEARIGELDERGDDGPRGAWSVPNIGARPSAVFSSQTLSVSSSMSTSSASQRGLSPATVARVAVLNRAKTSGLAFFCGELTCQAGSE